MFGVAVLVFLLVGTWPLTETVTTSVVVTLHGTWRSLMLCRHMMQHSVWWIRLLCVGYIMGVSMVVGLFVDACGWVWMGIPALMYSTAYKPPSLPQPDKRPAMRRPTPMY